MAHDDQSSRRPTVMRVQESLTGVERMKPLEADLRSIQGVEKLSPQASHVSVDLNVPQQQENNPANHVADSKSGSGSTNTPSDAES
jgi:hypothetical protein